MTRNRVKLSRRQFLDTIAAAGASLATAPFDAAAGFEPQTARKRPAAKRPTRRTLHQRFPDLRESHSFHLDSD